MRIDYHVMEDLREILAAFSEEIRLRIVMLLCESKLSVNCFVIALKLPQSTVSRHLGILRRCGIVKVSRVHNHSYYVLNLEGPHSKLKHRMFDAFFLSLKDDEPFRTDRKNLSDMKGDCSAACDVCV